MLSNMETPLGLTVIGPQGQALRIQRGDPAFIAGRDILRQALPAEQVWLQLQNLLANPLQVLAGWCARFGLRLKDEGDNLRLQDFALNRAYWLPLLARTQVTAGSPMPILRLAAMLGSAAEKADASKLCLHWQDQGYANRRVGIVRLEKLPDEVRVGDRVETVGGGACACLVSFNRFEVDAAGAIIPDNGVVIARFGSDAAQATDILAQPVILGFNQTYRCEEGSPDGWLEDLSFDSLTEARNNARAIQITGAEVRIINRITGDAVALS